MVVSAASNVLLVAPQPIRVDGHAAHVCLFRSERWMAFGAVDIGVGTGESISVLIVFKPLRRAPALHRHV